MQTVRKWRTSLLKLARPSILVNSAILISDNACQIWSDVLCSSADAPVAGRHLEENEHFLIDFS